MEYVLIVILAVYSFALSRRVQALEEKNKHQDTVRSEGSMSPSTQTDFSPIPPPVPVPPPVRGETSISVPVPPVPHTETDIFAWFKKDFFVKLGALLLLIASGWFVSYAFANNWIGPWGRIILGIVAGWALFGFGAYRLQKEQQQGTIFTVLGTTIVIMSVWAAREMYGFMTPLLALVLMVLPVVITSALSVRYRLPSLAVAGFVLGSVAPFFTASPEPQLLAFLIYLLLLVLGTLWVSFLIEATFLTSIALGVVTFWSAYFVEGVSATELSLGLTFGFAFTICFFVSNVASLLRQRSDTVRLTNIITGLGTGVYLYLWIAGATSGVFEGVLYAAWAAVYVLAGWLIFKRTGTVTSLYLYGSVGLAYVIALTAHLFSGTTLTMVYAVQLAGVLVATRFMSVAQTARRVLAWLYLPLCLVASQHITSPAWESSLWHRDFAALIVITASLIVSGITLRRGAPEQQDRLASVTLSGTAAVALLIQFSLVLDVLFERTLAATVFSLVTSLIAATTYSIAIRYQNSILKRWSYVLALAYPYLIVLSISYSTALTWYGGAVHFDALMLLLITISFWLAAAVTFQKEVRAYSSLPTKLLASGAGIYTMTLLWLVAHAELAVGIATALCLIIYTVLGLGLFIYGRMNEISFIRLWGAVILCGVVARLLLVEIWQLSITMRIITFFIVGILLISTAFIGRKRSES